MNEQKLEEIKTTLIGSVLLRDKFPDAITRKNYITDLNKSNIDYIVSYEIEKNDILFIFFSGFVENFIGLGRVEQYKGNSLYFRDKIDSWYDKKLDDIIIVINAYIKFFDSKKIIMVGQSMGGYAALYCSAFIDNSVCLSFSPQTFNRNSSKIILSSSILRNDPPWATINLHDLLIKNANNSKKYIFIGKSEHEASTKRFWGDLLFAGYMLDVPNVYLIITDKNVHTVYGALIFKSLLDIVPQNYDVFINDIVKSGKIFSEQLKYN